MDNEYDELEKISDELEKKWKSIRLYGGVNKAPTPLLVSTRNLEFLLAFKKSQCKIISLEDLVYELRGIDDIFSPMLSPTGKYIQYENMLKEKKAQK